MDIIHCQIHTYMIEPVEFILEAFCYYKYICEIHQFAASLVTKEASL